MRLNCEAILNGGFQFSSWISDLPYIHDVNSSSHSISVNISNFGRLGTTFIQPTQISIPTELCAPLYALIPGFFVPSIITWLNDRRTYAHNNR